LNNQSDVDLFESLDIEKIFDFRMPPERELRPLKLNVATPPKVVELPISAGNMGSYLSELKGVQPPAGAIKIRMTQWYTDMVTEALPAYQTMFQHLALMEGGALVICNTGKDRSGMAAGLILAALGVPPDIVTEDFMLSAWAYRDVELAMKRYLGAHPLGADMGFMAEVFTVYPEYIESFRTQSAKMAGSNDGFLDQCLDMDKDVYQNLRDKFTE
jgi:protein-tyrosine phosphatase